MSKAESRDFSIGGIILAPALISLAITVIRLIGELQRWPSALFKREAGGAGAIVGIVWLVPIFGVYFAIKLCHWGAAPLSAPKAVGLSIIGAIIITCGGFLLFDQGLKLPGRQLIGLVFFIAGLLVEYFAWPTLFKVMIAYGYSARIPVLIVMFFAMRGNWGTHYDAGPAGAPTEFWPKFLQLAVVPQMLMWIVFTVVVGGVFGAVAAIFAKSERHVPQPA